VTTAPWLTQAQRLAPHAGGQAVDSIPLSSGSLTFGSRPDRHIFLPNERVAAQHALLEVRDGVCTLWDTQSHTGTFVNGQPIRQACLVPGDRIQIGPFLFWLDNGRLVCLQHPTALEVVAVRLRQAAGKVTQLDNLSLVFRPGEFIGLLGPSGAGKTTLLDALSGLRPAASGQVFINGEPLYQHYDQLRHLIGYVPQDDIIHPELAPRQALFYAGRLRLPFGTPQAELQRRVEGTLAALDLTPRADVPIGRLSGGERKRASVSVELLSRPGILFLDEPTSGLDPSTESRLMRTFKQLAGKGRTVVCTTHVMENVDLFDRIGVLVPGGRLAFFGQPAAARSYFGITKYTELYDRLEQRPPWVWEEQYRASGTGQALQRQATDLEKAAPVRPRWQGAPPAPAWGPAQWWVLVRRFGRILLGDRQHVALLLAQPLVIAGLICLVYRELPPIFFLLVIAVLWFGCSGAAQQLVRERAVYRRERMVNLRLGAYVLSKFVPLALIAALQSLLMLAVVWLFRGGGGDPWLQATALVLTSWGGVSLGLLISALARNADRATSVVPLVLLPQVMLAGVIIALPDMNAVTRTAALGAMARWANQAQEVALLQQKKIDADLLAREAYVRPLWNLYPEHDLSTETGRRGFLQEEGGSRVDRRELLAANHGVLAGFVVVHLAVVALLLRRQDPF
jgi:ABC-type multidrug transport system ATPase subunit